MGQSNCKLDFSHCCPFSSRKTAASWKGGTCKGTGRWDNMPDIQGIPGQIRAVIFDLEDTLYSVDKSDEKHSELWVEIYQQLIAPVDSQGRVKPKVIQQSVYKHVVQRLQQLWSEKYEEEPEVPELYANALRVAGVAQAD